jgi:hypothetical protein
MEPPVLKAYKDRKETKVSRENRVLQVSNDLLDLKEI